MHLGIGPNSTDLLYKIIFALGITLLVTTLVITHQKNRELEIKAGLLAISITESNHALNGLVEQSDLLDSEIRTRPTEGKGAHTPYEKQKLLQELAILSNEITTKQDVLALLNRSKQETQNQGHLVYGVAAATISISLVMIVYGFLGWHFHLKIFKDRRKSTRSQ